MYFKPSDMYQTNDSRIQPFLFLNPGDLLRRFIDSINRDDAPSPHSHLLEQIRVIGVVVVSKVDDSRLREWLELSSQPLQRLVALIAAPDAFRCQCCGSIQMCEWETALPEKLLQCPKIT